MAAVSVAFLVATAWSAVSAFKSTGLASSIGFGILCIALAIVGLFLIPEVFLLPQDVGSLWFGSQLRVGMTYSEVDNLRRWTFGADGGSGNSRLSAPCNDESACVWYTTTASLCLEGGVVFRVALDGRQRVRSWERSDWVEGC